MYSAYFRLKEPPFSLSPDPRFLYMSERHREGMAHLYYGIQQPGGFVLLTGEIGSGKTTLCRSLVKQLPLEADVALILNPRLTVIELLATICDELGVSQPAGTRSIKGLIDALNRRLLEAFGQGRRTVLIIDEAQNLDSDVLEQIRLLTNLETSKEKLLQIVLIGQPELLQLLRQKRLMQLAQRITAQYHLTALSRGETIAYIRHRLSVAGRSDPVFTVPAMHYVYRYSRGVPRLINIICDRALLGAYTSDMRQVEAGIVRRASRETQGMVPWYRRIHPAWSAGYAGLAILMVGGALYFGTDNLSVQRNDGTVIQTALPAAGSEAVPAKPQIRSERADASIPGPAENGSTQTEPPKAAEAQSQPTSEAASDAAPDDARLAAILADTSLRSSSASSFGSLYSRLGLKIPQDQLSSGCEAGAALGFDCLSRVGNWTKLRYYDLPAILDLTLPSGARRRVTLVGLGERKATLAIGDREYTFPLEEIDSAWDGSFILVWRLPFPARQLALGARGEDVVWVRKALDAVEGKPSGGAESDDYNEGLRQRVIAFQRNQSLPHDGMVGSATLVRLSLAVMGSNAPSLSRHAP
jgi:general secretion pathway protein A